MSSTYLIFSYMVDAWKCYKAWITDEKTPRPHSISARSNFRVCSQCHVGPWHFISATIAGLQITILYRAIGSHQKIHLISLRISIFSEFLHCVLKHMYDIHKNWKLLQWENHEATLIQCTLKKKSMLTNENVHLT